MIFLPIPPSSPDTLSAGQGRQSGRAPTWGSQESYSTRDVVLYDSLLDGTGNGNSGNRDEIVATCMADTRKCIHLCESDVRTPFKGFERGY